MSTQIDFTRVNNDINGNPRYVCHYLEFRPYQDPEEPYKSISYEGALFAAKKLGGRKFHNKQYGGGVLFQSYNISDVESQILLLTGYGFEYINKATKQVKTFLRAQCINRDGNQKKWIKFEGSIYSLKK